ncbi:phytoene/squalene synthetase [Hasllibacter halocynthiae]|uniref:Phytoene/squalene synthetase n=1 Tax=Hasllibacter halocynthiae TaxID=595589 RepID=A0A2T0X8G3_9RHOB|nr:squalene/phytoene synthase family protein [Hasllibacter halocynthiae]PRY95231.1 phytoene/squalene synthetase [Hasllibacter halocynthiae]
MSWQACAALVERGDPDRFRAAMAAAVPARAILFPLYAFNVEVSRAPWLTKEPLIAEMRLQWWIDALEEIAGLGEVRRHEVTTPLAAVLDAEGARLLTAAVEARRWDVHEKGMDDGEALDAHLDATAGNLLWVAARALGAGEGEGAIRGAAHAQGLAAWLRAVPALEAAGKRPLPDGRPDAVAALARRGLDRLAGARRAGWPKAAAPAMLAAWRARPVLRRAARDPYAVIEDRLAPGGDPVALAKAALTGRL